MKLLIWTILTTGLFIQPADAHAQVDSALLSLKGFCSFVLHHPEAAQTIGLEEDKIEFPKADFLNRLSQEIGSTAVYYSDSLDYLALLLESGITASLISQQNALLTEALVSFLESPRRRIGSAYDRGLIYNALLEFTTENGEIDQGIVYEIADQVTDRLNALADKR